MVLADSGRFFSAKKEVNYQGLKSGGDGGDSTKWKEANQNMLLTVWVQLYDFLEKTKLSR